MKKSQLIERIAKHQNHMSFIDVELAVKALIEYLTESLSGGERIEIRNFGVFTIRHRAAKIGRNPKTGDSVSIPERFAPCFKPGKELSNRVNNK